MDQNVLSRSAGDLIYLISCTVNGTVPDAERCAGMNDPEVFRLANSHMVSAAAAYSLEKAMPLPAHWLNAKGNAKRRMIIFQAERAKVLRAFDEHGIWYLPLKGILLKDLYPQPEMREMSDNDILCDGAKAAEIRDIMESLGYTCVDFGNLFHDVYHKKPVSFEIHSNLFNSVEYPEAFSYYSTVRERLVKDENNRSGYHMTDDDFYIYIVNHMYKHFSHAGTGLRSLLDIYLFNREKGQSLNREYIGRELDYFGLRDFELKSRELAHKVFSLEQLSDSDKEELSFYINSGSYGTTFNRISSKLGKDGGKNAKRRYILRRIFPTKEHLMLFEPFVYRHRILYPFLVVYRPFRGLISKRQKLLAEYKSLKKINQNGSSGDKK